MTKYNYVVPSDEEIDLKLEEFQKWVQDNPNMPRNLGKRKLI
jgi:hypothetical protein